MAAVEVTISGVLYDKLNRTMQQVVLIGEASLTGLGVGGGPIAPPPDSGLPVDPGYGKPMPPNMIWGGRPGPGGGGSWVPPQTLPPDVTPPVPGSPPILLPGGQPTHPIVAPPFIIIDYPGMGKVVVPQPLPPAGAAPVKK